MLLLRVTALFIGVHAYVFLSGLVYHFLESPAETETVTKHLEQVVDKFFVASPSNRPKKSKQELIIEIRSAVENDRSYFMRKSFKSLWKSYMFALTTVTTVGEYRGGIVDKKEGCGLFGKCRGFVRKSLWNSRKINAGKESSKFLRFCNLRLPLAMFKE